MDPADSRKLKKVLEILEVDLDKLHRGGGRRILLSGGAACGKTALAKKIAKKYPNFRILNTGDIFREEARRRRISISGLMAEGGEALAELDRRVDKRALEILISADEEIAVTSRLASLWGEALKLAKIPCLSIYLEVSPFEMAERISIRDFGGPMKSLSKEKLSELREAIKRDWRDMTRYEAQYGANPLDFGKYALRINTTGALEEETWQKADAFIRDYLKPKNA
jgi:cytidylate kinase